MQGSYSATYSTGCDKPVCTRATLWRQHYITTSKEYLTNSHILSIYFELAFLQLHRIKISCKLIIIWVNYERNKKGARFCETQCIFLRVWHNICSDWPSVARQLLWLKHARYVTTGKCENSKQECRPGADILCGVCLAVHTQHVLVLNSVNTTLKTNTQSVKNSRTVYFQLRLGEKIATTKYF